MEDENQETKPNAKELFGTMSVLHEAKLMKNEYITAPLMLF